MKGNAKQAALNQEDLKREKQIQEGNNTYLLQAAVIFLAVVSFFTTANGMVSISSVKTVQLLTPLLQPYRAFCSP